MVVDDAKLLHKMYEAMLRQYPMVHAMNGREGLDRLREYTDIDLILLDINMPQMDGLEFLSEVKKLPTYAGIPVIIISTEGKEEDTIRGLRAGAAAYIKKPFRNEQLLSVIDRLPGNPA